MLEITSVRPNKKKKMMSIYIDGHFGFSMLEDDYLSLNIYEKKEITQEEIDHIKNVVNFRSAKSAAVKYLALRLRTEAEVSSKLKSDGFESETVKRVVEELKSMGYINDEIYAQKYIYDRSKLKPQSKKLLRMDLKRKGVSDQIIDSVLGDWEIDELSLAESLIRRKFGKYDLEDEKIIRRVYSFLYHRGFDFDVIQEAIKRVKNGDSPVTA